MTRDKTNTEVSLPGRAASRPDAILWTRSGLTLIECKKTAQWSGQAESFSAWVEAHARKCGVQPSVLWRHLGAVRYYLSLGREFDGLRLPSLGAIAEATTPESLELIEKIARAAPRLVTRKLLGLAIDGRLTRRELREVWQIYKPLLQGKAQRGRTPAGKKRAQLSSGRADEGQLCEADGLYGLASAGPEWTGYSAPAVYRTFVRPAIPFELMRSDGADRAPPDFIALVQADPHADVVLHGVEFSANIAKFSKRALLGSAQSFDYFWIAVPFEQGGSVVDARAFRARVLVHIGLMQTNRSKVSVVRRPLRNVNTRNKMHIAMLLLAHAAR